MASSARVLIVDDEAGVRGVCKRALERAGFEVETAANAAQARAALEARSFALVVTDVYLSGSHGVELAREIKARRPGTEVVVMTGQASVDTAVDAMKTGAADFLQKPFSPGSLVDLACACLRRRREAAAASAHPEAEQAKSEVVARVSHELRTPVSVALLAWELLKPNLQGEEQRALARHLDEGVSRLRDRVEEIVTFAAAAGRPDRTLEDLGLLAEEAAALCAAESRARGASVVVDAPRPARAPCEPGLVRAALKELISNAVRFGPEGGEVLVEARANAAGASVSVLDRGPGVPPAQRARVFEAFFQASGTLTREAPGLGLGLATVRRVADAHGGWVELLEREGGGTVARLTLPSETAP